jgi:hypothetical protein
MIKPHPDLRGAVPVLHFEYVNWRNERHTYIVRVESIEWTARGTHAPDSPLPVAVWQLHGTVLTRDGKYRQGQPRRSFIMERMGGVRGGLE